MSAQEALWQGNFGVEYHNRQPEDLGSRVSLFAKALARTTGIRSVIEFGAGTGDNIRALWNLLPHASFAAVEINSEAAVKVPRHAELWVSPVLVFTDERQWDLVLTRGVLIHVPPEDLEKTYEVLFQASKRFILLCEYFSRLPRQIPYRGRENALWVRDHAGEMMKQYPALKLVDYGFVSRFDPWPQDDITWFLMEKPE